MKTKRNRLTISFDDGLRFSVTGTPEVENYSDGTFSFRFPVKFSINDEIISEKTVGLHFTKGTLLDFFEEELEEADRKQVAKDNLF